jgi:hypothetical protein
MITNTGKSILGKYLLGQAPAYASYLAVGCGKSPLGSGDLQGDYSSQTALDFEMFRVPISSRGFINESGTNKIVFTAELPTEERYEISEVGIYSAGFNPSAGQYDSKTIFAFAENDKWNRHTSSAVSAITSITSPLDDVEDDNIIATNLAVFKTNADNSIFYKTSRADRYERCRFLNNIILVRGDESELTLSEDSGPTLDHFVIEAGSNHIHLEGVKIDLSENAPTDELRLAFSLISKTGNSGAVPDTVRILVDFASTDSGSGEYARFEAELVNGTDPGEYDFTQNRYFVVSKQKQELYTSANFTWDAVSVVKIYVSILDDSSGPTPTPSDQYYIALDAMRLENIATTNPLYGLVGYSVIQTTDAETIVKSPNTSNYIEFRFSIGLTSGEGS